MDSDELYDYPQRFPAHMLRLELEDALEALLRDQILDRERSERLDRPDFYAHDSDCEQDDEKEELQPTDFDVDNVPKEMVEMVKEQEANRLALLEQEANDNKGKPLLPPTAIKRVQAGSPPKLPPDVSLALVQSLGLDALETAMMGKVMVAVKREARRRAKRLFKSKAPTGEQELLRLKKALEAKNLTGDALSEAVLAHQLGKGGCVPCRSNPCSWKPCLNVEAYEWRKNLVNEEMERVKQDKDAYAMESTVCLSASADGAALLIRRDLMEELEAEYVLLSKKLELNDVDEEFHDIVIDKREYVQVRWSDLTMDLQHYHTLLFTLLYFYSSSTTDNTITYTLKVANSLMHSIHRPVLLIYCSFFALIHHFLS